MDRQAELGIQHAAGRAGSKQVVTAQRAAIVGGPLEEISLQVVVGDEGNVLAPRRRDASKRHGDFPMP